MENLELDNMNNVQFDVLREIGNIGAGNATTALASMLGMRVEMRVPKVELLEFNELTQIIGGEENVVAGILLTLSGDVEGMMMFVVEQGTAINMVNLLTGMISGGKTSEQLGEFEMSALQEIGNIITGAYLSSLSNLTKLKIMSSIPYLSVDMAGAILSVPAIEFGKLGDKALLIETEFGDKGTSANGYFILIPTLDSYKTILNSLGI